jgi:hypothetical protein
MAKPCGTKVAFTLGLFYLHTTPCGLPFGLLGRLAQCMQQEILGCGNNPRLAQCNTRVYYFCHRFVDFRFLPFLYLNLH